MSAEFPTKVGAFIEECDKSADRTISMLNQFAKQSMDKDQFDEAVRSEVDGNLVGVEHRLGELLPLFPLQSRQYHNINEHLNDVLVARQMHATASRR